MPADAFQRQLGITDDEIAAVQRRRAKRRHASAVGKS
jgi:hypothetical protein